MSKICNNCGNIVRDNDNFCPRCKSQSFKTKMEVAVPNNTLTHKIFYWNYDNHYVLSKSKVTSIAVFLMFSVVALLSGAPGAMLILAFIFAGFTYAIGFALHKIRGTPSKAKLTYNDYGLGTDLIHFLFFWQNKEGGFALSKTKIISHMIFLLFFAIGMFAPSATLFVAVLIGLMVETPAFLIGYGIHKLTNPNPEAEPKKIEPKKEVKKPKITKKPQVQIKQKEIIPEYLDYQIQLDELNSKFKTKEKSARNIIKKRFEPPQLTYTRFINGVDKSAELFKKNSDSAYRMIDLADEYSSRIADEIESKIDILKSILEKLDRLSSELVLGDNEGKKEDVDDLISEMDDLIKSVKDYE